MKSFLLDADLLQKIDGFAALMAEEHLRETAPDPFRKQNQQLVELKSTYYELCAQFFEKLTKGLKEVVDVVSIQPAFLWEAFTTIEARKKRGILPRDFCKIGKKEMEGCNHLAALLYEKKSYDKASSVYTLLTFLDPREPAFWLGLAHSEYYSQNYEAAIKAYLSAAKANPRDFQAHFHACHCYHMLGHIDLALASVEKALLIIQKSSAAKEWAQHAEHLKEYFKRLARGAKEAV